MRRYLTMTEGAVSEELQTTLENLEHHGNPWGFNNEKRTEWTEGHNVPTVDENPGAEYLFWVGWIGAPPHHWKDFPVAHRVAPIAIAWLQQSELIDAIVAPGP